MEVENNTKQLNTCFGVWVEVENNTKQLKTRFGGWVEVENNTKQLKHVLECGWRLKIILNN